MKFLTLLISVAVVASCSSKRMSGGALPVDGSSADTIYQGDRSYSPIGSDSESIEGLVSVQFEYDKASLTPGTQDMLQQNVEWIKAHPDMRVQLEGHCDSRGSIEYNIALGERRAQSVYDFLAQQGVDVSRLSVISLGEERPLFTEENEEAFSNNRRANFVPEGM